MCSWFHEQKKFEFIAYINILYYLSSINFQLCPQPPSEGRGDIVFGADPVSVPVASFPFVIFWTNNHINILYHKLQKK